MVNFAAWWRRPARKRKPSEPIRVIVWSKPDCCLCERAHDVVARVAKDYALNIEEHDINTDPNAFERFRYTIPVVEIAGGSTFEGKITEFWLRQALDRKLAAAEQ